MGRLETTGYYALGAPLYAALIAVEYVVARYRKRHVFGFADTISNLTAGFGEVVIGLFLGPLLIALYDFGFRHIALVRWPEGSPVPWLLAFVLSDLCYYWYHRAGHQVAALWAIHGVHHQSEHFNVSVAMRHPWLSDSYSALFYVPLPLLGVPPTHFFIAISVISFYALTIHTRFFNRPALYIFTTPATHVLHHATNPEYLGKNLGAMFNVWDRLFGTYVELNPRVPPELGTRSGYQTHDGVLSQWLLAERLLRAARQTRSWAEKLAVFVRHPGWLPRGVAVAASPRPRDEAAIPLKLRCYVAGQFAIITALGLSLLWNRDRPHTLGLVLGALAVIFGLSTLGGLLDGRKNAVRWEVARVGLSLGFVLALWLR
ncbi:MAG TPA: sterol desaturase family protein [Polyangiaceae bacterium]|nr:sterol desaturase family protein [Polyangiaceae bacterium]